ncbi:uncharacterized protein BN636_00587 [Ruminococcus sp. CAG:382]|nr:uncharacterized protein BN636_00587 [Ruminococcus sp. CAG:382]
MPSLPKLTYRTAYEWIIEVFIEMEAENPPHTDCHIRISRKVKIHLHSVSDNADPSTENGGIADIDDSSRRSFMNAEHKLNEQVEVVCEKYFFCQTDDKAASSFGKIGNCCFTRPDLTRNGFVTYDRTRDELREQRDIHEEI